MSKRAIFDKKNILVVGGAGFIGSHLCDRLVKDNKVICIDNFSTGSERNIDHLLKNENFVFIRADITEPLALDDLPELQKFKIQFQGIQEIYNCACPTSPARFDENKIPTLLANSIGMKHMLDLAVRYQALFIHLSSSVVYGPRRDDGQPIDEDDHGIVDQVGPRSSYDEGKRFAESMVVNYRDAYQLDVRVARIFRTYGPRMPLGEKHMVPDFINAALENKDLVIYGDERFRSSFCYVSDVIDALVKLAQSEWNNPINIGSDIDESLVEMAHNIISLTGSSSKVVHHEPILFMTPLGIPNISLAKEKLNWLPVTTLAKGLEKTVDDLRASKGLLSVENALS